MTAIVCHIVVREAEKAADWYARALGAETGRRIRVPDGRFMQIELRFGESHVMIADEFPEMGAVSPLTLGGTYGALTVTTDDATPCGRGRSMPAPRCSVPWRMPSGASAMARSSTRLATAGASPSGSTTCPRMRFSGAPPSSSAPQAEDDQEAGVSPSASAAPGPR
jgi:hypothetical protein